MIRGKTMGLIAVALACIAMIVIIALVTNAKHRRYEQYSSGGNYAKLNDTDYDPCAPGIGFDLRACNCKMDPNYFDC